MIDDKLLEKLRKLKALADDGKNEAECQTALLMFQKLLKKNNLSEAEVKLSKSVTEEKVDENVLTSYQRVPEWVKIIHAAISEHFRCVGVLHRDHVKGVTWLQFYGHTTDILIAARAFEAAIAAAERLVNECKLRFLEDSVLNGCEYEFNKAHYLKGFAVGLNTAYQQAEKADNELALIVQTPNDVLEAVKHMKYEKHRPLNPLEFDDSFMVGHDDGHNVGAGNRIRKGVAV